MTAFALDPVLGHALAGALALVLAIGAWSKLADLDAFAAALERYRLLPLALARVVAFALPFVEALAAALLVVPSMRNPGAALAGALLTLVTSAVAINLLRGRVDIDCGCGGPGQRLSWRLVARNAVLLGACALAAAPVSVRLVVWLDAFTATFAAAALWLVYAAVDQLLSGVGRPPAGANRLPSAGTRR
ncbi:MAG: methylamine utilization protein MauE [Burkholderiaceae bacterium]|nr:methylamine utilization protein MauE [Burkholderiaceae bacterium]